MVEIADALRRLQAGKQGFSRKSIHWRYYIHPSDAYSFPERCRKLLVGM
jgi:hypothetical protein